MLPPSGMSFVSLVCAEQYRISIYPAWWLVILTHRVRGSWTSMCGPTQQAGTRTCHLGNKLVLPNVLPRKHVNQPYNMFKICTWSVMISLSLRQYCRMITSHIHNLLLHSFQNYTSLVHIHVPALCQIDHLLTHCFLHGVTIQRHGNVHN